MTPKTPQTTADDVMAVVLGMRRVLRRRLRDLSATPTLRGAQVEVLTFVEAEPGSGVAAVARALRLAGNSVSTLVNQLVDAGLLSREVDPADRRAVRLFLTDAAHARLARWREARSRLLGDAFARLPAQEAATIAAALPALRLLISELAEEDV
ncbi:MarR family transcriptional regulator [Microtetraspora sp. NBRC 13810]|uniref:MarR family winged helix-turn-helix transcriptional regulator n=1 Tax=Microtetraspora sp. NBRC 13810 TaxID=3030990 RepID=UPI00255724D0|nr:MarR family transcriptional regulator [Microtetraspora sp. NBRC 13810]